MARNFSPQDLEAAVEAGVMPRETAEAFARFLQARPPAAAPRSRFDLTNLLWYAGALITMSAMGMFSTMAFGMMGGTGLVTTGVLYFAGLLLVGNRLWRTPESRTPGGLLIAAAIAMVPMIVFGLQQATNNWGGLKNPGEYAGFYTYIKEGWLPMELATLVVSVVLARRYPFTFIAFPAAMALWFLSMDLAAYLGGSSGFDYDLRRRVSLWFGILTFVAVWVYEMRPREADFGFWLHLVAAITFWGGLTFQSSGSEIGKALYFLINIGLIFVAVFMQRRVYAVLGVIGMAIYLGYLADKVFKDSLLFPFALSFIGLAIVWLGLKIARNQSRLEGWVQQNVPAGLLALRPKAAQST